MENRLKKYELWLGDYNLGQGFHHDGKAEKIAEVEATSFKIACCIYEHQRSLDSLKDRMSRGDSYIEDIHFGVWHYNPYTNSNSWTGKYYETEEEALQSFRK